MSPACRKAQTARQVVFGAAAPDRAALGDVPALWPMLLRRLAEHQQVGTIARPGQASGPADGWLAILRASDEQCEVAMGQFPLDGPRNDRRRTERDEPMLSDDRSDAQHRRHTFRFPGSR